MLLFSPPKTYAGRGAVIGCGTAIVTWVFPIPVALVVWMFGVDAPFGDVMIGAFPFFLAPPIIGAMVGSRIGRGDGS
ncbi:hypothetical protein ACYOEI_09060 [Singulisphaera rosea]